MVDEYKGKIYKWVPRKCSSVSWGLSVPNPRRKNRMTPPRIVYTPSHFWACIRRGGSLNEVRLGLELFHSVQSIQSGLKQNISGRFREYEMKN